MVVLAMQHILNLISSWGRVAGFNARVPGKTFLVWLISALLSFEPFSKCRKDNWPLKIVFKALGKGGRGRKWERLSWTKFICLRAKTVGTEVLKHIRMWSLKKSLWEGFVALLHHDISQSTNEMLLFLWFWRGRRQMPCKNWREECKKYLVFQTQILKTVTFWRRTGSLFFPDHVSISRMVYSTNIEWTNKFYDKLNYLNSEGWGQMDMNTFTFFETKEKEEMKFRLHLLLWKIWTAYLLCKEYIWQKPELSFKIFLDSIYRRFCRTFMQSGLCW